MRRVNWPTMLVSSAAVAVSAFSGYLLASWPPPPPSEPARASASQAPRSGAPSSAPESPLNTDSKTIVTVLGDSYSVESPASAGPEWPAILGEALDVTVHTEAVDDSGFVSPGVGKPFGARVPAVLRHDPDLIIVAGGVDDASAYPNEQIAQAADEVVTRLADEALQAQVVLVSPFSNGAPGPYTDELSTSLRQLAKKHEIPYVDATNWLVASGDLFAPDGNHPTDKGQKQLADRMEQAIVRIGVLEAPESPAAGS